MMSSTAGEIVDELGPMINSLRQKCSPTVLDMTARIKGKPIFNCLKLEIAKTFMLNLGLTD